MPTRVSGLASEAVSFVDEVTGRRVLQLTSSTHHSVHAYFDSPPWCAATGRLVFSRRRPGTEEGDIFVVDADGEDLTRVGSSRTLIPNTGAMPQWAPDGSRIYFRDRDGDELLVRWTDVETGESGGFPGSLRMIHPAGHMYAYHTERRYLTADDLRESRTQQGAFVRDLGSGVSTLVASVADCLTLHPRRDEIVDLPLFVKHTKWSPTGERMMFAFSSGKTGPRPPIVHELYVVDADGANLRRVGPMTNHPTWHPDGRRILTNSRLAPDQEKSLVLLDVETGEREVATDAVPGMGHPSYSPDGAWILLDDVPQRTGPAAIQVVDVRSGEIRRLVTPRVTDHSHDGTHLHPVWSQDGRQILYASDASGVAQLCVIAFP